MKILLIGPYFANANHGAEVGIYDALISLGHDVIVYDHRKDLVMQGDASCPAGLIRVHQGEFDLILCPGPGLPAKVLESPFWENVKGHKVLWNSEPIRLSAYRNKIKDQWQEFDTIFTFDDTEIGLYKEFVDDSVKVKFLPQAYNPSWYKPIHAQPKFDFAFVGSVGGKWENRMHFLQRVEEICKIHGWNPVFQTGVMNAEHVNQIYNSSKVVLNVGLLHKETPGYGDPSELKSFALQQRVFEAIGAGRVCLTNETAGNDVLTEFDNVVFYNKDNLEWAMGYCMENWELLSDNIIKSRWEHSYEERMKQLIGNI